MFWWQAVGWCVCGGATPLHPHFKGPMQGMLEFRLKEQAPVLALAAMCSPLDSGYCCVLGVVQLLCRFGPKTLWQHWGSNRVPLMLPVATGLAEAGNFATSSAAMNIYQCVGACCGYACHRLQLSGTDGG